MRRKSLKENIYRILFANWRGHPLYILLVYLLGQAAIDPPVFAGAVFFIYYLTGVEMNRFVLPVGLALLALIIPAYALYHHFSRTIRRFLAAQIAGALPSARLATATWREAITFPQHIVAGVIVACVPFFAILVALFSPRFGFFPALIGGGVAVTATVALSQVVFLFYLEWAMAPIARMALTLGAEPNLDKLGWARLRLPTKLLLLITLIVVLAVTVVGLFGYGQIIAMGGDPTNSLRLTVLVGLLTNGLAILLALLLVRSLSAPIRELQRVMEEVGEGNLDVSVSPLTADEISELGLHFNQMVQQLRQNEELAAAFGRYVSPAVRDGILSGTISLGGERRDLTILFTDIRDFTTWCEREEPESVIQTLNSYYAFLVQALIKHGGTVTRYTGDGVLALFGAPLDDPDHALHAVEAVWEARTLLDKFNSIRRGVGVFELRTGFGIHTGSAVVGSIGCDARAEYTPIGDAANVASRIEGLNKKLGTSILISDATYQRVAEWIVPGKRAETPVKGRTKPVQVVEVVGLRPSPDRERE